MITLRFRWFMQVNIEDDFVLSDVGKRWFDLTQFGVICFVLLGFGAIWLGFASISNAPKVLRIYCASVLKPVVESEILGFEKAYGCEIRIEYGGSGVLLERIKLSEMGDVYLAAERFYFERAKLDGLVDVGFELGGMKLVVAVADGNPMGVEVMGDLLGFDYAICDERAGAGNVLKKVLEEQGGYDALLRGAKVVRPTVSMVGVDVKLGSVDGAFVWDVTARQFGLEVIEVAELVGAKGVAVGCVLRGAEEVELGERFLELLQGERVGKRFKEKGFVVEY